ncbi:MAG: hypothetical protein FWG77_11690 [Treponema sp.]|nr:hypothetical protein [Treponema sp.]
MEEDDNYIKITPREELVKQGNAAVAHLASGAILMVLTFGARFRLVGMGLSAIVLVLGLISIFSKDKEGKKPGMLLTVSGILGLIVQVGIPVLRPFAVFFLGLGGFGFLASGIMRGIRFLIGLKGRR